MSTINLQVYQQVEKGFLPSPPILTDRFAPPRAATRQGERAASYPHAVEQHGGQVPLAGVGQDDPDGLPFELRGARQAHGGCRGRAYAASGNYLAEEPACSYEPACERAAVA